MSVISMVLVVIVAFLAGMEGVLDEFQFHQPLVACTLIGLVTGQLVPCIILGGSLQMIALGWANIGAAVAPDAALAAVASAIILVQGGQGRAGVDTAIAVAIPLAVAGLFLTMIVRTLSVICVHQMDAAAAKGSFKGVEAWHIIAVCLQGIRIAIPAAALLAIPSSAVAAALNSMPAWLTDGMSIGGGMVVAVKAFTDVVAEELKKGEKIQLVGFGTFEVSERAAREGRNPRSGEVMHIAASKAPKFKAGKALKDIVNE